MARTGIAPLSTTIALAFSRGSSTTSQRPTPKKITRDRTSPVPTETKRTRKARKRSRETTAGLSVAGIGELGHAIPLHRGGQSALPGRRLTMRAVHDLSRGSQAYALISMQASPLRRGQGKRTMRETVVPFQISDSWRDGLDPRGVQRRSEGDR